MKKKKKIIQPVAGVSYPGFDDLSRYGAVRINDKRPLSKEILKLDTDIMIHLTITGRCYAQCKGCVNTAITMGNNNPRNTVITSQDVEPERDALIIKELVDRHSGQTITVCFYGGEPFLASDKMEKTWRILKNSIEPNRIRFMVYTNGELLIDTMATYPEFMKDIWLYSVSIDGDEEQHNRVRQGTQLSKIKNNLREFASFYKGNILQWSTLREEQSLLNCFDEFMRLFNEGLVNHFFWHWAEEQEPFQDFPYFVRRYGQDLESVMDIYVQEISRGELLPIAHINELILFLLTSSERGHTACGVELAKNYDVVSGKVYSCADLPSSHAIGGLDEHRRLKIDECDLNSLVEYKEWLGCQKCGVHFYCGGRCPVQVLAGSKERTCQYCQLMRLHVGIVQERISDIFDGIQRNGMTLQEIFDHSAFLSKYTDVVP